MYIYTYIYIHRHICIHIYIYVYVYAAKRVAEATDNGSGIVYTLHHRFRGR